MPQGRLVVGLSVVPQDGVAVLSELDRTGAAELLGRLQANGAFAAGRVTELTPRTVRELHSTWANRLQVGRQRQGWLIETVRC